MGGMTMRVPPWLRVRAPYTALAAATIAVGLAVHWHGTSLGRVTRDVLGDVLWATMMTWCIAALAPGARIPIRAAAALAICFAVEASQLYHTPGLDALRSTTLGHLFLGSGFDPRDLAAYTLGVLAAAVLERTALRRTHGVALRHPR